MELLFDSLNPYESLDVLTSKSPDELVMLLKGIRTPIKIIAIVADNGRHSAYIMGDIRKKKTKNLREKDNG